MSEKPSSRVKEEPSGSAIERARAYGIDISLLEANLERTPLERMQAHDAALNLVSELRAAKNQYG